MAVAKRGIVGGQDKIDCGNFNVSANLITLYGIYTIIPVPWRM